MTKWSWRAVCKSNWLLRLQILVFLQTNYILIAVAKGNQKTSNNWLDCCKNVEKKWAIIQVLHGTRQRRSPARFSIHPQASGGRSYPPSAGKARVAWHSSALEFDSAPWQVSNETESDGTVPPFPCGPYYFCSFFCGGGILPKLYLTQANTEPH